MAEEIDYEDARSLLHNTWEEVLEEDISEYIDDYNLRDALRRVLANEEHGTKTFKYMLLTNVLAKAVNPDLHYRALKAKSTLSEPFSSGELATQVVTEWEKANGQRLGGSNEPRTNKPYFDQNEVSKDYDAQNMDVYDTLYWVLCELEKRTSEGNLDPETVLKQALYEVSRVSPNTVEYTNPPEVSFLDLESAIDEYLVKSNLGERLAALTAGVVDAQHFDGEVVHVHIRVDHVNVSDKKSDAAGDIEVFKSAEEDELIRALEVKDKKANRTDVQHAVEAARRHELDECLFVAGQGFEFGEDEPVREVITDAPIEVVVINRDDLKSVLKLQGRSGRKRFRKAVGIYLNDMKAHRESKQEWKRLVESLEPI